MDKKAKKRIAILREKVQKLKTQLANERKQPDDPDLITSLQADIESAEREIASLSEN